MQMDPSRDWQALGELYRQKSDEELEELAQDYADLTEVAREVLRSEMKARGLDDPAAPKTPEKRARKEAVTHVDAPGQPPNGEEGDASQPASELASEYTWKTPLCTCATMQQAKQIAEMLRRAEIENWIEGGVNPWDAGSLRVVVAADELDEARAVMAKPIPQDVVDESTMEAPEYVAPRCPACGAEEPVLESVEPVNHWLCEACGKEWNEGAEGAVAEGVTPEGEKERM